MTLYDAKRVQLGDILISKQIDEASFEFKVEAIEHKMDESNLHEYIVFKGTSISPSYGNYVFYTHKQIRCRYNINK